MSLDLTKPVQTRDGSPVEIVRTNLRKSNGDTILALIDDHPYTYQPDGRHVAGRESELDLVNVGYVPPRKKKFTVEVQLRRAGDGEVFPLAKCPEDPDGWTSERIASTTIEMEYEEQP